MNESQTCPDAAQLQALLTGTLPAGDQERLSRHVEKCPECQQTLDQMAASSWEQKARQLGEKEETPAAVLHNVIQAALDQPTGEQTQDRCGPVKEEDLSFLAPPIQPDHLGRLSHYEILEVIGKGGFGIVFK